MNNADEFRAEYQRRRDAYGLLHPSIGEIRDQILENSQQPGLTAEQCSSLLAVVKHIDEELAAIDR